MGQSPSLDDNSRSANEEILVFMETERSLPC
jgi:hypothetical protein